MADAGFGDVEHRLTGGKEAGACGEGRALPVKTGGAQCQQWNQTPGLGLDSILFWNYQRCEVQGRCGDTHKP